VFVFIPHDPFPDVISEIVCFVVCDKLLK